MLFQILPGLSSTIFSFLEPSAMASSHPLSFYPLGSLTPTQSAQIISLIYNASLVLRLLIQVIGFYNLSSSANVLRKKEGWPSNPNYVTDKLYDFGEVTSSLSETKFPQL